MKKIKDIAFFVLRASITIGLLVFLFVKIVDIETIWESIQNIDIAQFVLAASLFALAIFLLICRWTVLLKALDIKVPFLRVITAYMVGLFCNLFFPSSIGGDLVRGLDLAKYEKSRLKLFATVVLDRLIGFVSVVMLAFLGLLFSYKRFVNDVIVLYSVGILAVVLCFTLIILFNRGIFSKLASIFNRFEKVKQGLMNFNEYMIFFRNKRKILAFNLVLSFIIQVLSSVIYYLIGLSLGLDTPLIYYLVLIPIVNTISVLPITIGGLGLRDCSAKFFFEKVGMLASHAVSLSLIWFFFTAVVGLIGGVLYVCTLPSRRIQHN